MRQVLMLLVGVSVPAACFGLLMWLSWLEDTLPSHMDRSRRRHVPEPVLAIPLAPVAPEPEPEAVPVPVAEPEVVGLPARLGAGAADVAAAS